MKISLLLTGNELMSGDTVDSNSAYIAQSLKDLGQVPYIKKVVGDDLTLLVESITELSAVSDVLVINGGLGPTVDDLTALALARATSTSLQQHVDAIAHLERWAKPKGFMLTESNLKQAELPEGCEIIDNPVGSAVGFRCDHNGCLVLCTPGVPSEFKLMVEQQILPLIKEHGRLTETGLVTRLRLFGVTESGLQDIVNAKFPDWPAEVDLGFRVQLPVIEVKFTSFGDDAKALNLRWAQRFSDLFSDFVIGEDDTRLSQSLNRALESQGKSIVTAESCTGGAIAAGITSEAGASSVFHGGFVTYSNEMKTSALGVNPDTLEKYGAVSKETVIEMAEGALAVSEADLAVAISGIAGPTGGSESKKVGTVWIAWGCTGKIRARRFFLPIGRFAFQRTATAMAMDLVRRELLGLDTTVDYFSELKRRH